MTKEIQKGVGKDFDPDEHTMDTMISVLKEVNKEKKELKKKFKGYDESKSYNENLRAFQETLEKNYE